MKKVFLKESMLSIGGSMDVTDESGAQVLKVEGAVVSMTNEKRICDMSGRVLYTVKNRVINPLALKAYIYDSTGKKIATVRNKIFTLHPEYFVKGLADDIKIEGGFFSLSCDIIKNGQVIGKMKREITVLREALQLEAEEEDIPLLTALVVAVNNILHKSRV